MHDEYIELEERIHDIFDQKTQESLGSYDEITFYDEDDFYDDTIEELDYDSNLNEIADIVSIQIEDFLINREFKNVFKLYYFLSHLMQEVLDTELSNAFYEELYDIRDIIKDSLTNFLFDGSTNDKREFLRWSLNNIDYLVDDTYDAEYKDVEDYLVNVIGLESDSYTGEFIEVFEELEEEPEVKERFVKDHPIIFSKYLKALKRNSDEELEKINLLKDKYSQEESSTENI